MTISDYLVKYKIEFKLDLSTSKLSAIKAGGIAKYVVYPKSAEELITALSLCKAFSQRFKIIGGCTNTFFGDFGFDGIIISTKMLSGVKFCNESAYACAGTPLISLLREAAALGIDFTADLFGIPGSVGGALRNNAGAYSSSISDCFDFGFFYDLDADKTIKLNRNELSFSYRSSILQSQSLVFLNGKFKGKTRDKSEINEEFKRVIDRRRASQPSAPSLGSFFKRNGDVIPSLLIDRAGLKGLRVGGAMVSEKHAGFIVNADNATASDVNNLAKKVENEIFKKYHLALIREAEYVT